MISARQLRELQKVGQRAMTTTVTIRHRTLAAKDPSNPFGDDTVGYETTTTTVKGWLAPMLGKEFETDASQVITVGDIRLRVPVGTLIDAGDEVVAAGVEYTVVETSIEQTWPEWTTAFLKHIQ